MPRPLKSCCLFSLAGFLLALAAGTLLCYLVLADEPTPLQARAAGQLVGRWSVWVAALAGLVGLVWGSRRG